MATFPTYDEVYPPTYEQDAQYQYVEEPPLYVQDQGYEEESFGDINIVDSYMDIVEEEDELPEAWIPYSAASTIQPGNGNQQVIIGTPFPQSSDLKQHYCDLYPEECAKAKWPLERNFTESRNETLGGALGKGTALNHVDLSGCGLALILLLLILLGLNGGWAGDRGGQDKSQSSGLHVPGKDRSRNEQNRENPRKNTNKADTEGQNDRGGGGDRADTGNKKNQRNDGTDNKRDSGRHRRDGRDNRNQKDDSKDRHAESNRQHGKKDDEQNRRSHKNDDNAQNPRNSRRNDEERSNRRNGDNPRDPREGRRHGEDTRSRRNGERNGERDSGNRKPDRDKHNPKNRHDTQDRNGDRNRRHRGDNGDVPSTDPSRNTNRRHAETPEQKQARRDAQKQAERDARDKAKEEARQKAKDAEKEARDKAKEKARQKAKDVEKEARDKAKEEARQKAKDAEKEARDKAKEKARQKAKDAEKEARDRAKEEARQKAKDAEKEARDKAKEEARQKAKDAEKEARDRAKEEARQKAKDNGAGTSDSSASKSSWISPHMMLGLLVLIALMAMAGGSQFPQYLPTFNKPSLLNQPAGGIFRGSSILGSGPIIGSGPILGSRPSRPQVIASPKVIPAGSRAPTWSVKDSSSPHIHINNVNSQGDRNAINIDYAINIDSDPTPPPVVEIQTEAPPVIVQEKVWEPMSIQFTGPANPDRLLNMILAGLIVILPLILDWIRDYPEKRYTEPDYISPGIQLVLLVGLILMGLLLADWHFGWTSSIAPYAEVSVTEIQSGLTPVIIGAVETTESLVWGFEDVIFGEDRILLGMGLAALGVVLLSQREPSVDIPKTEYANPTTQALYFLGSFIIGMFLWNA
ncbi:uncharacterized protein IL334_000340 [Kwoniella shivajii]|uniref:Uncharacterized protein n=1 Tax=Kwoniella shivajii TaxID=564305 RepID=A0ABZ1CP85_9TREE|nr:hypothetical protein IL334_000340 [Kwoniella shivajii]